MSTDIVRTAKVLQLLLAGSGKKLILPDRTTGELKELSPALAAAAEGLLPVFLVAGDAVWREATGRSFGLGLRQDPDSLIGYRAETIAGASFAGMMLSVMEAVAQVEQPTEIPLTALAATWQAASARLDDPIRPDHRRGPSPAWS